MKRFLTALLLGSLLACPSRGQEVLPLGGVVNARDLGGIRMKDGRKIKPGLLIRSAELSDATEEDIAFLQAVPVKKVIDFRVEVEKRGRADKTIPAADYVNIPVNTIDPKDAPPEFFKLKSFNVSRLIVITAFNRKAKTLTRELYISMLTREDSRRQYAAFMKELVRSADVAVLYHCTRGKDRSGLATAFVLGALGADKETIVKDFDLTNKTYAKDVEKYTKKVKSMGGKEDELEAVKAMAGANTERFAEALDYIDEAYGSMKAYLTGPLGLSEKDIQTLQERYLEK